MLMFACASCVAGIFSSYLYIYGMCSDKFDLDPHVANNMVTVYWISYACGRFSAMIVAQHVPSWAHMLFDIIMTLLAIGSLTAMDYLLPLDLPDSNKIAALIVPTIIIGFFVSVSNKPT